MGRTLSARVGRCDQDVVNPDPGRLPDQPPWAGTCLTAQLELVPELPELLDDELRRRVVVVRRRVVALPLALLVVVLPVALRRRPEEAPVIAR